MITEHHKEGAALFLGDALENLTTLAAGSIDCIITSPPYLGLRDYGTEGQIGLEETLDEYLDNLIMRGSMTEAATSALAAADSVMFSEDAAERAARAMFAEEQCDRRQKLDLESNWNGRLDDRDREEYRSLTRAVIEALRESTA